MSPSRSYQLAMPVFATQHAIMAFAVPAALSLSACAHKPEVVLKNFDNCMIENMVAVQMLEQAGSVNEQASTLEDLLAWRTAQIADDRMDDAGVASRESNIIAAYANSADGRRSELEAKGVNAEQVAKSAVVCAEGMQ